MMIEGAGAAEGGANAASAALALPRMWAWRDSVGKKVVEQPRSTTRTWLPCGAHGHGALGDPRPRHGGGLPEGKAPRPPAHALQHRRRP